MLSLGRSFAFISERERAEELEWKTSLAVESERLSKVLLDSVSHELRTPLTTITGSVSALRNAALAENEETRKVLVDGALDASDRLNRIVEDILSMSRIESGNLRLFAACADVADLANQSIAAAGPELDPGRVILSVAEDSGPVRVDIGLFTTLSANLLRNASRYSPPGSPVEFSLKEEDGGLWVQVRDRGPGVPAEELDSLFERFRRGGEPRSGEPRSGEPRNGGLGLGLAICKGIAKAHGGTISASNAEGGGLCVRAFFPACVMGDDR
jgi:two-component system sensor histidine kinase KdpD